MKRTRAYRRFQKQKAIRRAYRIASFTYWNVDILIGTEEDKKFQARRLADNFTLCSCQSCRNPRHSIFYNKKEKLTIQERKILEDFPLCA